jgi:hypothetical protein
MTARLSFALALVLSLILQSSALPNLEGDELYLRCKESDGEKWGYCTGFADGVAYFLDGGHEICLGPPHQSRHVKSLLSFFTSTQNCAPTTVTASSTAH